MCDSSSTTNASSSSSIIVSMDEDEDYLSDSDCSYDSRREKEMDAANMLSSLRNLAPPKPKEEVSVCVPAPARPPSAAGDKRKLLALIRTPASSTATLLPAATFMREMSAASTTSASSLGSSSSSSSNSSSFSSSSSSGSLGGGGSSTGCVRAPPTMSTAPGSAAATLAAGDAAYENGTASPSFPPSTADSAFGYPRKSGSKWTGKEDDQLRRGVGSVGECHWDVIAAQFLEGRRSAIQCSHRWQKVLRPGLIKGPWTQEEDEIITTCRQSGVVEWKEIALRLPGRLGKQCRDRWLNHLDPAISKRYWTEAEDKVLAEGRELYGNAWAKIARLLPGRPENSIKNRWYSARRAQERSFVATPQWDLKAEKAAIFNYCLHFQPHDCIDSFLTSVTSVLRSQDPEAYSSTLADINRQKLNRRLTAGLKREAGKYPPTSPLCLALQREKLIQQQPASKQVLQARKAAKQAAVVAAAAGAAGSAGASSSPSSSSSSASTASSFPSLSTTTSSLTTSSLSASSSSSSVLPPSIPPSTPSSSSSSSSSPPSEHMTVVMALLQDALRVETNPSQRDLLQRAVYATVQSNRAAVNYVEGILGGGFARLDLEKKEDRDSLVEALTSAVRRGLFVN